MKRDPKKPCQLRSDNAKPLVLQRISRFRRDN